MIMEEEMCLLSTLDRIAAALEGIGQELGSVNAHLESLDELQRDFNECVGFVPPNHYQKEGYNFFRIGGSVDNGNY